MKIKTPEEYEAAVKELAEIDEAFNNTNTMDVGTAIKRGQELEQAIADWRDRE